MEHYSLEMAKIVQIIWGKLVNYYNLDFLSGKETICLSNVKKHQPHPQNMIRP